MFINMVSAKKVLMVGMLCFLSALFGVVLLLLDIEFGRYLVYFVVPVGAITVLFGVVASIMGKLERDY
jgi:ABC-type Fe3+-siderophore transport system permease subunit